MGVNLYFIAFDILLAEPPPLLHEEKTKALFDKLWVVARDQALQVYATHRDKLARYQSINLLVSSDIVNRHLETFSERFKHQENALAIIPLFTTFYEDINQVAAAMLWLLQQGISEKAILQTHVMQRISKCKMTSSPQ